MPRQRISRISTRLTTCIHNDIQADIFDKIIDADWLAVSKYTNGDVLNLCQRVYRVVSTQVTELSEAESSRMAMDF